MKLLIGYDGSPNSDIVIDDMKWAGLPKKGEALVLSIANVFVPPAPDASVPTHLRSAIERSRERCLEELKAAQILAEDGGRLVKKALPEWEVRVEATADSPAWALVKKAEEWKPELTLVGAHGHSPMGRFLGSVSQMVLLESPNSVRVARRRLDPKAVKERILIGVDGSLDAEAAIEAVMKRTWTASLEIHLVSVMDPQIPVLTSHMTPSVIRWFLEKADDEKTVVGRMLESYAKKLRESGAVVTCLAETGDPKKVLVEQAERWKADTLFVGARGLGHLKRFLIGGTSASVAARAHCTVEIVRRR